MNFTGTIERVKRNENKKFVEVVVETAEVKPNFFTVIYFFRDESHLQPGQQIKLPELKPGCIVFVEAYLSGRKYVNPDTGEVSYFLSLMAKEIIIVKKGGSNE
jgi:hypothetical protein